MNKENPEKNKVEFLLKKTLRDDLPGEVEFGMKRQLDLFREKMAEGKEPLCRRRWVKAAEGARMVFSRGALAFASILMLAMGSLMQMSGSRSVLADSISSRDAAIQTYNRIRSMDSMECMIKASGEGKQTIMYTIEWLPSGGCRAAAKIPGVKKDEPVTVVEDIDDPVFDPVRRFLSSPGLGALLDGKWKLKQYRREGECEYGTFTIKNPGDSAWMEITTDLCTSLPVTLAVSLPDAELDIRFMWSPPPPSLFIAPGRTRDERRGTKDEGRGTREEG